MIEAGNVRLRAIERTDLSQWRLWINDPEVAAFVDRVLPVTELEHEQFFERNVLGNRSAVWFAIELVEDRTYVGNIWLWGIDERHRKAEVRIIIGERRAWNNHVGSEALALLRTYAFAKLGLHKLFAYVHVRNPRARGAFLKAGYAEEATLRDDAFWDGAFCDVWRLYALNPQPS